MILVASVSSCVDPSFPQGHLLTCPSQQVAIIIPTPKYVARDISTNNYMPRCAFSLAVDYNGCLFVADVVGCPDGINIRRYAANILHALMVRL